LKPENFEVGLAAGGLAGSDFAEIRGMAIVV